MFQTLALQQLGKLINPVTGKMERDLQQARITIDMLHMIKEKTAGNLSAREKGLLDGVLTDLQLNYVDELKREEPKPEEPEEESAVGEPGKKETERAAEEPERETAESATEKSVSEEAETAPPPPRKKAKKRATKAEKEKSDPKAGK